jgi:nucleoside-diphosphate-sugar epimerase
MENLGLTKAFKVNANHNVVQDDLNYMYSKLQHEFSMMAGKNLLIVGGAGFLGYYLIQSVLNWNLNVSQQEKIKVTVFDNHSRGLPEWLEKLKWDPMIKLVFHDITQPLMEDIDDFQYIIHAASIASPFYYRLHPIETMDANVTGLRLLLDYCLSQKQKGKPVEGFLFFSTSEIYGDPSPENIPTPETYRGNVSCTGPRACYDESKRFGETLCVNFAQQYQLPIKIARPFNNYGPGLKITDRRVLPDFARDVLSGRDIVMLSDGKPSRTFCYIADAIVGYYKILLKGRSGEAYNIGVETPEISMEDLAKRVVAIATDLFDYQGQVVLQQSKDIHYLTDNPNRRCPVIDKAKNELDYSPSIEIDDGLRRAMIWYGQNSKAVDA